MFQLLGRGGLCAATSILLRMWSTFHGTKEEEKRDINDLCWKRTPFVVIPVTLHSL